MAQFDFRTVTPIILEAVKKILDPYKAWQIRDVSKGAANVYLWVSSSYSNCFYYAIRTAKNES